jgi:hypothetical protein
MQHLREKRFNLSRVCSVYFSSVPILLPCVYGRFTADVPFHLVKACKERQKVVRALAPGQGPGASHAEKRAPPACVAQSHESTAQCAAAPRVPEKCRPSEGRRWASGRTTRTRGQQARRARLRMSPTVRLRKLPMAPRRAPLRGRPRRPERSARCRSALALSRACAFDRAALVRASSEHASRRQRA